MGVSCTPVCNAGRRACATVEGDTTMTDHPLTSARSASPSRTRRSTTSSSGWPGPAGRIAETVRDWSQGVPVENARSLVAYWEREYDWRRFESELNSFPQFLTTIDGLDIHFLHVRSAEPRRAAAAPDARLADVDRRLPEVDRPAHGSRRVRRRCRRLLRRRHPVAARDSGSPASRPTQAGTSRASPERGRSSCADSATAPGRPTAATGGRPSPRPSARCGPRVSSGST